MTTFNITLPSINNTNDLILTGQSISNGLAIPVFMVLVFVGIIVWMKGSKISVPFAATVTLFLSLIAQSLGWINSYVTLIWLTVFVLAFISILIL